MSKIKRRIISAESIEKLANELADKPFGSNIDNTITKLSDKSSSSFINQHNDEITRVTISLPTSLLFKLEDMAKINKREKNSLKSVSAIIRSYIEMNL